MDKSQKQHIRDFNFSLAETIAQVERCERLCPTDTIMELCETIAGIMVEQTAVIATLESLKNEKNWQEVRERFERPLVGERFYSSHMIALCDMMRLARHMKELSERKDELLEALATLHNDNERPILDAGFIVSTFEAIPKVRPLSEIGQKK